MFPLIALPPELLSAILNSPGLGDSVVNLWKCGDKSLNSRLSKNLEINVHLESINRLPRSRFPKVLFSLSLTTLSIFSPVFEFQSPRDMSDMLQRLPNCLVNLTVNVPSRNSCFVDFSSFPAHVTRAPGSLNDDRSVAHIWNVGAVFPRLQSLNLPYTSAYDEAIYIWNQSDLSLLPASLTDLKVQFHIDDDIDREPLNTAVLPRGLRRFEIWGEDFPRTLQQVQDLPPMLEYLRVDNMQWSAASPQEIAQALPKTLTTFEAEYHHSHVPLLACLPHLKELNCHGLPTECYTHGAALFPNLKAFFWYSMDDDPAIAFFGLGLQLSLPSSLTSLCIPAMRSFEGVRWPAGLTHLEIMESGRLCPTTCLALPSVSRLLIAGSDAGRFQMVNLKFLPKSVVDLRIQIATDLCSDEIIAYDNMNTAKSDPQAQIPKKADFPPHLTRFEARVYIIQLECLADLPDSILKLEVTIEDPLTAEVAKALPSGLRKLEFGPQSKVHADALMTLPSSLTSLLVKELVFPDASSNDISPDVNQTAVSCSLPPSLRKLTVNRMSPSKLPVGARLYLPDSLEVLHVEGPTLESLEIVRPLPPSLRSLTLDVGYSRDNDTGDQSKTVFQDALLGWCPLLPPTLTAWVCSYHQSREIVSASILEKLPSSVTQLSLKGAARAPGDARETFLNRRLVLHTPDRRLLNELNGTDLKLEYYEVEPSAPELDELQDDSDEASDRDSDYSDFNDSDDYDSDGPRDRNPMPMPDGPRPVGVD